MLVQVLVNSSKLAALARPAWRLASAKMASGHAVAHGKHDNFGYPKGLQPGHMDEMPVPKGSWKESYDRYQAKYNRHLITGVLVFFGTLGFIIQTKAVDLVLAPPMKNPK